MSQGELIKKEAVPPIERFEVWLSKEKNKQIVLYLLKNLWRRYGKDVEEWSKLEFAKMRNWIVANPSKAPKSDWKRFVNHWLCNAFERTNKELCSFGYYQLQGISNYQEQKHYERKKR